MPSCKRVRPQWQLIDKDTDIYFISRHLQEVLRLSHCEAIAILPTSLRTQFFPHISQIRRWRCLFHYNGSCHGIFHDTWSLFVLFFLTFGHIHSLTLMLFSAFLYSGLSRRKSALSLIMVVSASNAVCIFQWVFWGYSLAFSRTANNGFLGNLANFGLIDVLDKPAPGSPLVPELLYALYQMECACVTVAIMVGGIAERGRILPAMVITFFWMTLVYCPLACWAWNPNGWGFKFGVLDFAG